MLESGAAGEEASVGTPTALGPALITGAGRGIGRAIAVRLAQNGARVCLVARTEADLQETAALVRQAGGEASCVACDVTDDAQVDALVSRAVAELGGLSVLVNNAGGAHRIRATEKLSIEDFESGTELNYGSVFKLMRLAAPHLFDAPTGGAVINIVSIAAFRGLEGMSYYSGAKAAVLGLTRATAREWGPRDVTVNAIAPGWIVTDLSAPLRSQETFSTTTLDAIPVGRWGEPDEVAQAAAFLASRQARYITGECLAVDGGLLA